MRLQGAAPGGNSALVNQGWGMLIYTSGGELIATQLPHLTDRETGRRREFYLEHRECKKQLQKESRYPDP